jgi:hypothetical protein
MKQRHGLFLFCYRINHSYVEHTVFVNCNSRTIFCNTLGYCSFAFDKVRETQHTHKRIARELKYARTSWIYAASDL